jgi:anaerobic selenocysteine-containing dehydrogenase
VAVPVWDLYVQRLADYTPEKVEAITDVSAETIREAALAYATRTNPEAGYGNGGIQYMLATEHYGQAGENVRCIDLLTGITGNYDTPGGMRGATRAPMEMGCADQSPALGPGSPLVKIDMSKKLGGKERPMYKWWSLWGDAVYINKTMRDGDPFPIKAGMNSSGDFMNMCNAKLNYDALIKLDFFFSTELWFSPITGAADIVLPVHHWLEVNAGRRSQGSSGAMGANIRCVEPAADTIWDPVICQIIYMKMGTPWSTDPNKPWPQMDFDDPFSLEAQKVGEYSVLDAMVQVSGHATWDEFAAEFAEKGWWDVKAIMPQEWGVYRRYEVGQAARFIAFSPSTIIPPPPSPGFSTPTTKHEIWSTIMETCWPDQDRELTKYFEPLESPVATPELFEKYPFICMTGRRIPVYFHNEHRQLPWCRELWPTPRVEINPADAAELGIEQGDWVWIENDRGKIRQTADLYYGIKPGMINCEHQWWFPELNQADRGFALSGCNCLVDPMAADQDTGASMVRGYAVKIYKATPENSPFSNPVPCGNDGTPIIADSSDPRLKAWLPAYDREEAAV